MKKYLSLIAVLALLVACMIPFASAAGQITLTIGDVVVDPADAVDGVIEVEVPVSTGEIGVAAGEFGMITVSEGATITSVDGVYVKKQYNVDCEFNPESTTGVNGYFVENEGKGAYDIVGDVFYITIEIPADKIASYTVSIGAGKATSVDKDMKDADLVFTSGTISFAHECTAGEPVKENEKAPTCTEKGSYDLVVYCTECKKELSRETKYVDALGHKAGEWEVVAEATCVADGKKVQKCSVCGEVVAEEVLKALGHDVVKGAVPAYDCEAGYKTTNTCSRCDWTETVTVEGHAHAWGVATVIKAATVDETGLVEYKCTHTDHGCEGVKTEETPKLNPDEPDPTGDITPYIAMGVLTMVALISSAAYMLLKRKAI